MPPMAEKKMATNSLILLPRTDESFPPQEYELPVTLCHFQVWPLIGLTALALVFWNPEPPCEKAE